VILWDLAHPKSIIKPDIRRMSAVTTVMGLLFMG
jgi:hypothetical protein